MSAINKIIEATGLGKKEINAMIKEREEEFKGLLSKEGAVFLIAKELNVNIKGEKQQDLKDLDQEELNISGIEIGMVDVTLIGRIKQIDNVRSFVSNGVEGHVGSFLMQDNTGSVWVVLWNDQVKILNDENFKVNTLLRLSNGNVKSGKYRGIEIHLAMDGKIEIISDDTKKIKKIKNEIVLISDINERNYSVSVKGKIVQIFQEKEFRKKTGEKGKILTILLLDSTKSIIINFWDDFVEKIRAFKLDDIIMITNLLSRFNEYKNSIELNSTLNTEVKKVKMSLDLFISSFVKINELKKGEISSFKGIVNNVFNRKALDSNKKTNHVVTVSDDSGTIRVVLWNEMIEKYKSLLEKGNSVILRNILVKFNGYLRVNEVSILNESIIEVTEDLNFDNIVKHIIGNYKFSEIDEIVDSGYYEVKGLVVKGFSGKVTIYKACLKCMKKEENCKCEGDNGFELKTILSVIMDDGSGTIRVVFIGDQAERVLGHEAGKLKKIEDTLDYKRFINERSEELLGQDLVVRGKARFSNFSKSFELFVHDYEFLDIKKEIEELIKKIGEQDNGNETV